MQHLLDDSLPAHGAPGDVRFGSKADICSATRHVRFTPNSDIDCVLRRVRFAPKPEPVMRCAEDDDNVASPDDRAGLKPAITLSRNDWLLRANRALV